jgi:uncharacterized protein (TIGR02996 family)
VLPADAATACAAIWSALASRADEERAVFEIARDARLEGRTTAAREIMAQGGEPALLAAVYAAPDDDQPRRDFAAWLAKRNDPRGEFITLQLARAAGTIPSDAAARREKRLLAEHKTRWLGALAEMVKTSSAWFHRGFLDDCALKGTWQQRLDDDPAWATVRSLAIGNAGMIQLARIQRDLALESIVWEMRLGQGEEYGSDAAIAAFRALRLPKLRRVRIHGDYFRYRDASFVDGAAWCSQLVELELPGR